MKFYHEASKIVKPKLEALAIAEGQMDAANKVKHTVWRTLATVQNTRNFVLRSMSPRLFLWLSSCPLVQSVFFSRGGLVLSHHLFLIGLLHLPSSFLPCPKALNAAEMRLQACTGRLQELQSMFDNQMMEKKRIEDGAMSLQRKMNQV